MHGANNLELLAIDVYDFVERVFGSEKGLSNVFANDGYGSAMAVFKFREKAPFIDIDLAGLRV